MEHLLKAIAAVGLFLVGLRLSAFFSGAETGFYRLSLPRLSIDARAGEKWAKQLLWFSKNPAYFVATCLIGNNVANYLTTAAIGWGALILFTETTEQIDIAATLLMSPIIFQFGELLPKSVYYLTPVKRLQKDIRWFRYFFRAFIFLSYPLVLITRLFEKLSAQKHQPAEIVLGRSRLVQLMQHGHEEGVLTDVQSRLTNGLLQLAPQVVTSSMTPVARILGMSESATREELLVFAKKIGISGIILHRDGQPDNWYYYSMVSELLSAKRTKSVIREMPVINPKSSKLVALHQLQCEQATYGIVRNSEKIYGIVARNGLIAQIFRPEMAESPSRSA